MISGPMPSPGESATVRDAAVSGERWAVGEADEPDDADEAEAEEAMAEIP